MHHMKRNLCTLLTFALTLCLCALPAAAADEPAWKNAYRDAIGQNTGEWVSVCQLAYFNLDGTPELIIGRPVLSEVSAQSLRVNGDVVPAGANTLGAYATGGSNYFKPRDLSEALSFDVGWDESMRLVIITTEE